jgi:hypothetical protein
LPLGLPPPFGFLPKAVLPSLGRAKPVLDGGLNELPPLA